MEETILRLTVGNDDSGSNQNQQGQTGGNSQQNNETQQSQDGLNVPNTGFMGGISTHGVETFFFGFAFIVAISILTIKFVAKSKKREESKAVKPLSILLLFSVFGGLAIKACNSFADSTNLSISTKENIDLTISEETPAFDVYCGTDEIVVDDATEHGYKLFLKTNNDGKMISGSGNAINSVSEWGELASNTWGFNSNTETEKENFEQIPVDDRIIINKNYETGDDDKVYANYCVKAAKDLADGVYEVKLSYLATKNNARLGIPDPENLDPYEDSDNDGVLNWEEEKYNLNSLSADSDLDSLSDYDELFIYGTDPLVADTDGDGMTDYSEVELADQGFNPAEASNTDTPVTYTIEGSEVTMTISGTGNIPESSCAVIPASTFSNSAGAVPKLYDFSTPGQITGADVSIKIFSEDLGDLNANDLTLYYIDYEAKTLEMIETNVTVLEDGVILSAHLDHFSGFFAGLKTKVQDFIHRIFHDDEEEPANPVDPSRPELTTINIVIDDSWSMYSEQQAEEMEMTCADGEDGCLANDPEFKRIDFVNNLLNKLDDGSSPEEHVAVGFFSVGAVPSTSTLSCVTGSNQVYYPGDLENLDQYCYDRPSYETAKRFLNDYQNGVWPESYGLVHSAAGTWLYDAWNFGNQAYEFDEKIGDTNYFVANNYLIILSDGQDNSGYPEDLIEDLVSSSLDILQTNTAVITIGIGNNVNESLLRKIAEAGNGKYYHVDDASAIDEIVNNIKHGDKFITGIDIDGDGIPDAAELANSGFKPDVNGFSFKNFVSVESLGGHCTGMARFAELYYTKKLPQSAGEMPVNTFDGNIAINKTFGFDLRGTYFSTYNNLYNYTIKSDAVKTALIPYNQYEREFDEETATLVMRDEDKTRLEETEIIDIISEPYEAVSIEQMIEEYGTYVYQIEKPFFNESKMQNAQTTIVDNEDKQLFNAILALHMQQYELESIGSAEGFGGGEFNGDFMKILIDRIKSGVPVAIDVPAHTVNAINVFQDLHDHNLYYIGIYNSNLPGIMSAFAIRCSNIGCVVKNVDFDESIPKDRSDFYTDGTPLFILKSLDDAVEYFNKMSNNL